MNGLHKPLVARQKGAALIIVLAFVVLLTGVCVAYLSRTTSDRQVANSSFNQSNVDQLTQSAMDNIIGDLRQEITNGSTAYAQGNGTTVYVPTAAANMVPQRSGNAAGAPNLLRRSVRSDQIPSPGLGSRASAVNSQDNPSANGRKVTSTRWNGHYLIPKKNTGTDDSIPIDAFTAATPDWVFVTPTGATVITSPNNAVIGRYSYAVYAEGGLLDTNVAGYPTGTTATQSGRKGSPAYADLTALASTDPNRLSNPDTAGVYQIDRLVGWRNYATTQPTNNFPDTGPPANKAFAYNFQGGSGPANLFTNYALGNTNGFLSPSTATWNNRTDQMFVQRQQLIAFRKTVGSTASFSANVLQYLSTFSRETNAPSFSPSTPAGSTIDYAALATTATAINPNFLLRRVTNSFTRFDGTTAVVGEPLVKTRFPLSRLAWITYKGPSAAVYALNNNDPIITALLNAGVSLSTIQAGTAANVKACFGLMFGGNQTVGDPTNPWVYTNPGGVVTTPASRIMRLDEVAGTREPDFFEVLQAGILSGSLGQSSGGVTPTGSTVFGALNTGSVNDYMGSTLQHLITIGACIIDQADPDSVPTRIQFTGTNGNTWTGYGTESLPYISQIYPIAGTSPADSTRWATYLLFQLWNPHKGGALATSPPQVRVRADGNAGIFTGGNSQTWTTDPTHNQTFAFPAAGISIALTVGVFPQTLPTPTPVPLGTPGVASVPAVGSASAPGGFERLPGNGGNSLTNYVGLRLLPDYTLTAASSGNNPQLNLYLGTDSAHPFNARMEYLAPGTTTWIPYNYFVGINDTGSWINGDTVPVRNASGLNGTPGSADAFDNNAVARLKDFPLPDCLMKPDPRATRFGIFQFKQTLSSTTARISDPLWPTGSANYPNGYGGSIADPAGPVEHAPIRFLSPPSGTGNGIYFPATLCMSNAASTSSRTGYADLDAIIRPADAANTEAPSSGSSTGSATPYYATTTAGSADYHPIILNRPLRTVAELGYAFRDLPWKTLDFFSDKSADAGLLDIFTINDGAQVLDGNGNIVGMAPPRTVAGPVNLNTTQAADVQAVLAGSIFDEVASTTIGTGNGVTDAPQLATNIVTAISATPMLNVSELITRNGLPTSILPLPAAGVAAHDQRVKTRREVVGRAVSSLSQTRAWNALVDVVAQSGHYKPNATSLPNDFVVEGEQHYWVHVAIDRFTGQVIDKQIEVVNE
jgi:hypothetical protein